MEFVMKKHILAKVALPAILAAAKGFAVPANAAGVKVGVLTCDVQNGWGYILGSSKDIRCNYVPNKTAGEHYSGSISKGGGDIGYTQGAAIILNVIAPPP